MKAGIVALSAAALLAVAALSLLGESGHSRTLSEREMVLTLGNIGDDCPCDAVTGTKQECNPAKKVTCNMCKAEWCHLPDCTKWQGPTYTGATYVRCDFISAPTLTCHDGTPGLCYQTWTCGNATSVTENTECVWNEELQADECKETEFSEDWWCRICNAGQPQSGTEVYYYL